MGTSSRHSSDSDSWMTPLEVIEAARATLGSIDLDPASCAEANEAVRAAVFYGPGSPHAENGYTSDWFGRVFLNPPGGRCDADGVRVAPIRGRRGYFYADGDPIRGRRGYFYADGAPCRGPAQSAAKLWWERLAGEWMVGNVFSAVFVGFSVEILQTTQVDPRCAYVPLSFPLCFPERRLAFRGPGGSAVSGNTHSSVIVLLPPFNRLACAEVIGMFKRQFGAIGAVINTERWENHG